MRALWLAALLCAPARAARPLMPPAPEFQPAPWVNSKPLSLALMRGRKVVLVAFLNPTDLHSLRLLSALKAWFDRYALDQLMIIGVVTPSYGFQSAEPWVRAESRRVGIEFPLVVDASRRLWKDYAVEGWPSVFVVDRKSRIVFDRLGEGGYGEIEAALREALADVTSPLPAPVAPPEPKTKDCGHATPGVAAGAGGVRPLKVDDDPATRHVVLVESREGELATRGNWTTERDALRLARPDADRGDFVRVVYEAPQALAVLAPPPGRRTRFFVKVDGQWLYEGIAGRDVRFDDDGRSFVDVAVPRLFDLARDSGGNPHELFLLPGPAGGAVHGFQFADACLATDLP